MTPDRSQRVATAVYRRVVRLIARSQPAGSAGDAAAVFADLQREAYARGGWPGLLRCWLAEASSVGRLLVASGGRDRPGVLAPFQSRRPPMGVLMRDGRDAVRSLSRSPAYTLLVVGILALGIGINTAIFSVVDALLFKPLPYADPGRLVFISEVPRTGGNFTVSPAAFLHLDGHQRAFDEIAARVGSTAAILSGGEPENVPAANVSARYFDVLGVRAVRGRTFIADDGRPGEPCRAVISHKLWVSRFSARDEAVGGPLALSGRTCTLVGVLPDEPVFDRGSYDLYLAQTLGAQASSQFGHVLTVIGRLARDVTIDQARAEVATTVSAFNEARGAAGQGWTGVVTPWRDRLVRADAKQLVAVLFAAVGVVLLVSCVNVANLSLARTAARRREIAIRTALGASRWRVFRALVTENVLLAVLGGVAGIVVGSWSLRAFLSWLPANLLPPEAVASLDGRTLAFTLGLSIVTGFVFGAVPAWHGTSGGVSRDLASGGRSITSSRLTRRLRSALLVCEVALAMTLVAGAMLLVTSFLRLTSVSPGFSPDRVLTMRIVLPATRYQSDDQVRAFYDQALDVVRRVPAVRQAGAVTSLPLSGWLYGTTFLVKGAPEAATRPSAHEQHVTDGYFETLGIPLVAGRTFRRDDRKGTPLVAIVNNTFARRFIPDGPALGQRLTLGFDKTIDGAENSWEIVGVVADVKTGGLGDNDLATPEVYMPFAQAPLPAMYLAVAGTSDAASVNLATDVRAALHQVDPELPPGSPIAMADRIGLSVTSERFRTGMVSAFALLAGLLACLGVYAVSSQTAQARVREIGIRLALGATPRQVVSLVLWQGLALVGVGLAIGLAVSIELVHVIQRWLFATRPTDPVVLGLSAAALGVSALLASWVPARRAGRVDPLTPLRSE